MSSTKQQRENRLSLEGKLDKSTVLEKQAEKDAMAASKQERERERNEHQLPFLLSSNESESDSTEDIFDDAYGDDVSKKKQRNSLSGYVLGCEIGDMIYCSLFFSFLVTI